jgi:murein L,D-transpeptidase YafK
MLNVVLALSLALSPTADTLPPGPVRLAGAPSRRALSPAERAEMRAPDFIADSMVLDKSDRRLTLFHQGRRVREYAVALGRVPVGAKQRRGDGKTPEGMYYIEGRNPRSRFHLSLRVSYPTTEQRARAARLGVSPGGDIMIHGLAPAFASVGEQHRTSDWTEGCVAVTNDEIEEIWRSVPDGAWILIQP